MKKLTALLLATILSACGGEAGNNTTNNNSNVKSNDTFLDYLPLNKNSIGNIVNEQSSPYTNWKTTSTGVNSGIIQWANDSEEFFTWDGSWIYLEKYRDPRYNITYDQYATKQEFCQNNVCTNIFSNSGKQIYAPYQLLENYTLDTVGYIINKDDTLGKRVEFRHIQNVTVGVSCSNPYFTNQKCIIQNEKWWDNNGSSFLLKINRNTWYAKNLGPGFIIQDNIPTINNAYLK